jgi:hypothetical protein
MHSSPQTEVPLRRVIRRSNEWTLREHEVVISYWPDVRTIRKLLPHRTQMAIKWFAGKCNLRRPQQIWTADEDTKLKRLVRAQAPKKQIAAELGRTLNQISHRMQYTHLRYDRRPPKPRGHALYDSIARRAFDLNMSMRELDECCGSGTAFRRFRPHRPVGVRKFAKAIRELGGRFEIAWDPLTDD